MRRAGFTFVELMVVGFLVIAITAYFLLLPHRHHGESANYVKCASNLRQIGQAMLLYANENHGHYPRTVYHPDDNTKPTWGTGSSAANPFQADGPAANDITASLFLLIRTQEIEPEVFVCPSTDLHGWTGYKGRAPQTFSNWADWKSNLSYSFHNPFPNKSFVDERQKYWTNELPADFALASDLNPGTTNGENTLQITPESPASKRRLALSRNHSNDGQSVLFGDGHVEFCNTPLCGVNQDNIFLNRNNQLIGPPIDSQDSILLPAEK